MYHFEDFIFQGRKSEEEKRKVMIEQSVHGGREFFM